MLERSRLRLPPGVPDLPAELGAAATGEPDPGRYPAPAVDPMNGPWIPRRVVRRPEECAVVATYREPDRYLPDGTVVGGAVVEQRQAPGRGWQWLGRLWFWRTEYQ